MPLVFVNYRTGDEDSTATLFAGEIDRRFGSGTAFRASSSIAAGTDFERSIRRAVQQCDVLLALVGTHWLDVDPRTNERFLDNRKNWVRREIELAERCGVLVVPVLVGRLTPSLDQSDLPPALSFLSRRQTVRFDHRSADSDLDKLTTTLRRISPALEARAVEHASARRAGSEEDGASYSIGTNHGPAALGPGASAAETINNNLR